MDAVLIVLALALGAGSGATTTRALATTAAPGLVAAYSMDAGAGMTLDDDTGNGNSGAIAGPKWTDGKFGRALSFDGIDDWVTIQDAPALDLTTALTIEAWVKPNALPMSWSTVLMKEQAGDLTYGLSADSDKDGPSGNLYLREQQQHVRTNSSLPLNAWSHLALSFDGSAMRLYVNGVQVASRGPGGTVATSSGVLRLGGNAVYPNQWFKGAIDEVRLYNRALSGTEIRADMDSSISPPPSVFVSPTGSDANPCSAEAPCSSLGRAYLVAAPGEIVELADGSYPGGAVNADPAKTSLTDVVFRPAAGASVTISGELDLYGSHIEFRDLKFAGGWKTHVGVSDVTFRNVSSRHFFIWSSSNISLIGGEVGPSNGSDYDPQITEAAGSGVAPMDILIDGVSFHDWWRPAGTDYHTECLQVGAGVNVTIRNSRFWNCATHDIFIRSWGGINGGLHELKGWTIENNFFGKTLDGFYAIQFVNDLGLANADFLVRNNSFLQGVSIDGPTTTVSLDSNILANQATYGCTGAAYRYNIYESLQGTGGPCGVTDRVATVQYADRAALDLHLVPGSPGIDEGNPTSFPATDIDGQSRPRGAAPDIGADEN